MSFKISGAFYRMTEPAGAVIDMEHGMESYIVLRFYEPMIITIGCDTTVTQRDACVIYAPNTPRRYCAVNGGFTNDYFSFIADSSFIEKYDVPVNRIFYLNEPDNFSPYIGFITWALTDVLHDHDKLIMGEVDKAFSYIQANKQQSDNPEPIHNDYVILRDNVRDNPGRWTVELMAKEMYLSRSHFSVNYKMIFGISPGEELNCFIIEYAKKLLCESVESVSTVAEKCGYANPENFTRAFKKATGITPRAYRCQKERNK